MDKNFFLSLPEETLFNTLKLEAAYCHKPRGCYVASLSFPEDFSPLLPYLKPRVKALYYEPERNLIFKWPFQGKFYKVALSGKLLKLGIVADKVEAREALSTLLEDLKAILQIEGLAPDFKPVKRPQALEIYRYLPKTNCRACGELTCLAFAAKVSMAEAEPEDCPHLEEEALTSLRRLLE